MLNSVGERTPPCGMPFFASLDVVCIVMNLMSVPEMFVCSSFLISVCMFIVSTALLISCATVIVRAWGAFG